MGFILPVSAPKDKDIMRKIYFHIRPVAIFRLTNSGNATRLKPTEKNYFNTQIKLFVPLVMILITLGASKLPTLGFSAGATYTFSWHSSLKDLTFTKFSGHAFAPDIYWYIHSGIHDAEINIPPEGYLLQKISI